MTDDTSREKGLELGAKANRTTDSSPGRWEEVCLSVYVRVCETAQICVCVYVFVTKMSCWGQTDLHKGHKSVHVVRGRAAPCVRMYVCVDVCV